MSTKLPAKFTPLVTALAATTERISTGLGDVAFLKLLKEGLWVYGGDETEVEEGNLWAVNPEAFMLGFQAWGEEGSPEEGEILGEEMALITDPPILKSDLPDVDAPWKQMLSMQLACIIGEDKGTALKFGSTSKGGIKAINQLMQKLVKRIKDPDNEGKFVPVIELKSEFYKHKKYGRIYTPILEIVKWLDIEDVVMTSDELGEYEEDYHGL